MEFAVDIRSPARRTRSDLAAELRNLERVMRRITADIRTTCPSREQSGHNLTPLPAIRILVVHGMSAGSIYLK